MLRLGSVVEHNGRACVVCNGLPLTGGGWFLVRLLDIETREVLPFVSFPDGLVDLRQTVEEW